MSRIHAVACILLVAAGADVLWEAKLSPRAEERPILVPLARFPRGLLGPGWQEEDRAMAPETLKVASVDDYIQRAFTDGRRTLWLYAGYVKGWNPAAIHHPAACFPSVGLRLLSEEDIGIPAPEIPVALRFRESLWSREDGGTYCSLTAFYYRGGFAPSEYELRRDRVLGIGYYAIVTVAGDALDSPGETRELLRDLLRKAVPELLKHFP